MFPERTSVPNTGRNLTMPCLSSGLTDDRQEVIISDPAARGNIVLKKFCISCYFCPAVWRGSHAENGARNSAENQNIISVPADSAGNKSILLLNRPINTSRWNRFPFLNYRCYKNLISWIKCNLINIMLIY